MAEPSRTNSRLCCILTLLLAVWPFFSLSSATSSPLPAVVRLDPISTEIKTPTGLAVDLRGRVYVAETMGNRVLVFSQGSRLLHAMEGLAQPVSVALAADGRIYIGNKKTGSVSVYDGDSSHMYDLGKGPGEFGIPSGIAVDNLTGTVFVADAGQSVVKIYHGNGSFSRTLGQPGNGNGQFHHPVSLAVDAAAGELAVLDWQQVPDTFYGTLINGARIQYFDLSGAYLRGYSRFGYNLDAGELAKPVHIAVDVASRLYVTDSLTQKVLVYNSQNAYLGHIDNEAHTLRTPLGLAISPNNRLYVSSLLARRVEVYGIGQYTAMDVSPPSLSFESVENGADPAPQIIHIINKGNTPFSWTATNRESWLTVAETTGTMQPSDAREISISVSRDGLQPGTSRDLVEITLDTGLTETVAVTFDIEPNPLQVDPPTLSFKAEAGATPAGQLLTVATGDPEPVIWSAAADAEWILISKDSGSTPAELKIYAAAAKMTAGTYSGTITFASQAEPSAPVRVAVTLDLADAKGPPDSPPPTAPPGGDTAGRKWTLTQVVPGTSLNGIWGSSEDDIFAVGSQGTIMHHEGGVWTPMPSGTGVTLHAVWGSSADDVYAVGGDGVVLHYDGKGWNPVAAASQEILRDVAGPASRVMAVDTFGTILDNSFASAHATGTALRSIWGSSDTDVFAAGEAGAVLHYDGATWTSMDTGTENWLNSLWGSSDRDVYAVGEQGTIIHYDGAAWQNMDSGTKANLYSVWGGAGDDVFAVGEEGHVLHYNGTTWTRVAAGTAVDLNDVWISPRARVYVVGEDGFILRGRDKFPWHFIHAIVRVNTAANKKEEDRASEQKAEPTESPGEPNRGSQP